MTIIKKCDCGAIFRLDLQSIVENKGIIYAKPVRIVHIRGTDFKVYGVEIVCPICGKVLGSKFDINIEQERGDNIGRKRFLDFG